jgi:hypothetical protein
MPHALQLAFEVSLVYLVVSGLCAGLWIAFALVERPAGHRPAHGSVMPQEAGASPARSRGSQLI